MDGNDFNIDNYEISNRLNRRIATIDEYYITVVTNKPFSEYFGDTIFTNIRSN